MQRSLVPRACTFVLIVWLAISCSDSSAAEDRAPSGGQDSEQAPAPVPAASDASTQLPVPAVALSSTRPPRNPSLASTSREQSPTAEAVQHLNAGLRAWRRGQVDQAFDECEEAIKDLDDAIRLDPYAALNYANRARSHTVLGRDESARQDLERATALNFNRSHLEVEIAMLKRLR